MSENSNRKPNIEPPEKKIFELEQKPKLRHKRTRSEPDKPGKTSIDSERVTVERISKQKPENRKKSGLGDLFSKFPTKMLSKTFDSNDDATVESMKEFSHTSKAETFLSQTTNKKKEPPKKAKKFTTSKELSTYERNYYEVTFSSVILYNGFILLIMLLIRIGPNFSRPEELSPLHDSSSNITRIEEKDIKILFSLTYYVSASVAYIFSSLVSVIAIILGRGIYSKFNKKFHKFGIISLRFTVLFMSSIFIFLGQLTTTIGVLYISAPVNFYIILCGRIIYGFADGMQEIYILGYIADEFKNKNFANAVSLFIAIWSVGKVWVPTYHRYIPIDYYLWFITSLCFCALIVVVLFGSIHHGFHSHLKNNPENLILEQEPKKFTIQNIVILICGAICFLYIRFTFYLSGWVFPFSDYGRRFILSNFPQVTELNLVAYIQLAYFCRAVASPCLSALIQSEYENHGEKLTVEKTDSIPKSELRYCFGILQTKNSIGNQGFENFSNQLHLYTIFEHKFHFLTLFIGLFVCAICNILLHYSSFVYTKPVFSIMAIILGISLASVSNAVFSFPFLWISKFWNKNMISQKYQAFMGIALLMYNLAQLMISHVFNDGGMFIQWWIGVSLFFTMLFVYLIILGVVAFFHRFEFVNYKEYQASSILKQLTRVIHFFKLIYALFIDILIFVLVSIVLFIASGSLNVIISLATVTEISLVEVIYLPVLFILMCISLFLVYPGVLTRFGGVLFFKNCRRESGFIRHPLVSQVMSRNTNMTLAVNLMKSKYKSAWTKCQTRHMKQKVLVKVTADDYIATDTTNFPRIQYKLFEDEKDFDIEKAKILENDYLICCENGWVQFRDSKNFYQERYIIDIQIFSRTNMLLVFSAYTIYFLIPIVRNLILGKDPINISDPGGAIISFLNFFFGIFLLLPQIALWVRIYSTLESLRKRAWRVYNLAQKTFASENRNNLSFEAANKWNAEFGHLQDLVDAKSNFLKKSILFCLLIAKSSTSTISILALFSSLEVKQALFFALFLEISVLLFILLPGSTVTYRMEQCLKTLKKSARGLELKLSHKKQILESISKEEDQISLIQEMELLGIEDEQKIDHSMKEDLTPKAAKDHLAEDIYLNRVSLRMHFLYKLWQARIPLGFQLNFTAVDEFNFKLTINKELLSSNVQSLIFTLIPAFVTKLIQ